MSEKCLHYRPASFFIAINNKESVNPSEFICDRNLNIPTKSHQRKVPKDKNFMENPPINLYLDNTDLNCGFPNQTDCPNYVENDIDLSKYEK